MLPGTVIAERYRVVKLLGEGGMGAVYEGEHLSVGRKVAIKVLHETFARKPGLVDRFEREARAAAAVGHENIIDVFDFGAHEGRPYMVMEHLRGESLSARLDERVRLAPDQATAIMGQVLSGLAAAHRAGIVHRDLKPDNVFLIARGGYPDFVKLLDFGISKIDDRRDVGRKSLTRAGLVMGTPYYMSPEQALAKADVDGRADLYSAGVLFYEMLTGRVPFDAESETELLMLVCQRPTEPPAVHEIDSSIPEELSRVVQRALAHDRDERFASAEDMLEALAPFGARAALPAGTTGPFRRVSVLTAVGSPAAWSDDAARRERLSAATPVESLIPPVETAPEAPARAATPVPDAPAAASSHTPMTTQVPAARPRSLPVLVTVAAVALAAAVAGLRLNAGPSAVAAAQSDVRVEFALSPPEAEVSVDGELARERVLHFPRGSRHHVVVRAPQFREAQQSVVAERDQLVSIALAPDAPAPPPVPAPAPAPTAPNPPPLVTAASAVPVSASAPPRSPHRRADSPTAAPARAGRPAGSLLPATTEY